MLTRLLAGALLLGLAATPVEVEPGFRAIAILEHRPPGAPPRVRFEWDQRPRADEYLLIGSWTAVASWTVQIRDYRVTRRNATSWDDRQVTFEVALEPGSHSWKLVPVRSPQVGHGREFAQLGFELR